MDLSESNIIRLLEQGIDKNSFNKDVLFRRSASSMVSGIYVKPTLQEALRTKAYEIQNKIPDIEALSLHKDNNLHGGKEYFWLIFHDSATSYVVSRLLIEELKEAFGVRMADRNSLLDGFLSSFHKTDQKLIVRTDISSFFESIDHRQLFWKLESNPGISSLSKALYRKIFKEFERHRFMVNQLGKGLPRGLSVSSYLAEVYLQDIDQEVIRKIRPSFYGRYVDDIILTSSASFIGTTKEIFPLLKGLFSKYDLHLHEESDGKTNLTDLTPATTDMGEYLGYRLIWRPETATVYTALPAWKIDRKKKMIDKAFAHFEKTSRFSPQLARRELTSCLNYISGNFRLSGSKEHIRTGIYYSNRHLTDFSGLDELTEYLHSLPIIPYSQSFPSEVDMLCFTHRIYDIITKVDFAERWRARKTFTFSPVEVSRLKGIMKID